MVVELEVVKLNVVELEVVDDEHAEGAEVGAHSRCILLRGPHAGREIATNVLLSS